MDPHTLSKGLEFWTLQTLIDVSIMAGLFATGLALARDYLLALRDKLTLRVSLEVWDVAMPLATDLALATAVLIGFLTLNPDVMADVKIALPFLPVGTLLYAVALVIRLFHGGHQPKSPKYKTALSLMLAAVFVQVIGFSLVMEGPSHEYLATHPSAFWEMVKTHLISSADPHGLELAQLSFEVLFPALLLVFGWAIYQAFRGLSAPKAQGR